MPDSSTADTSVPRMQQLLIFIGEQDQWHGRPLYLEILDLVRAQGGAGATVLRGLAGYSADGRLIHACATDAGAAGLPVAVVLIDTAERIAALLPTLEPLLSVQGGDVAVTDLALHRHYHTAQPGGRTLTEVGQIMETQVATVPPDMPVADLLPLLLNKAYKALPVVDAERHVLGMVTDGDLLKTPGLGLRLNVLEAVQAQGGAGLADLLAAVRAGGKTARDVMGVRPGAVIGPDAAIAAAARLMLQQGVKRLPVVDREHRLIGIVGRLDILKAASRVTLGAGPAAAGPPPAGAQVLRDMMLRDVPTVRPATPVRQVVDALVGSSGARRVVVTEGDAAGRVVGIITASDLVRRSAAQARAGTLRTLLKDLQYLGAGFGAPLVPIDPEDADTARNVMTAPVITAPETLPLGEAIRVMVEHQVKALPVVDPQGRLAGMVNRERVLQALAGP